MRFYGPVIMERIKLIESTIITSDTILDDINSPFKIVAGPGAGKTYWLINHIKNVLKKSDRLTAGSKVACISYTNVAVDEILRGLDIPDNRVEVSTIHAFLYKNIIKPYIHLLKDNSGNCLINIENLSGPEEHVPRYDKVKKWIDKIADENPKKRIKYYYNSKKYNYTTSILRHIFCTIDDKNKCTFKIRGNFPVILNENILSYKELYWAEGTIDYNDVLYLSYIIIDENPKILKFLSAKYPYLFLDEFQDTNPIQTRIVKLLGEYGVVIGIIGDPAQSIYSFNGAKREDFIDFKLEKMNTYTIEGNRRSTFNIIQLLNHVRKKDEYIPHQKKDLEFGEEGQENEVIISQKSQKILEYYCDQIKTSGIEDYCILARNNEYVREIKASTNPTAWNELEKADHDRATLLKRLILGQKYAEDKNYYLAIKNIMSILDTYGHAKYKNKSIKGAIVNTGLEKRRISILILYYLINNYKSVSEDVLTFYKNINQYLQKYSQIKLKNVIKGEFKRIATGLPLSDLYRTLEQSDDVSKIRTIHKSKGAEFDSVLVMFDDVNDFIKYIVEPDINSKEDESRIQYVALSRAKNRLYLGIPTEKRIENKSFQPVSRFIKVNDLNHSSWF